MKKTLIILFILISRFSFATNYYVKNGGNNELNGQSDSNAWETIAKVNTSTFLPGDTIFFKRGDTFKAPAGVGLTPPSSGTSGSPIVFSAYGTGAKPIISSDIKYTGWKVKSPNVYYVINTYQTSGGCWFTGLNWGITAASLAACDEQYEYYQVVSAPAGGSNDTIYIYTTTPSDTSTVFFSDCLRPVYINNKDYITIEKLKLTYGGIYNVSIGYSSNIKIDSCHSYYAAGTGINTGADTTITITKNIIEGSGNDGIYIGAYDGIVEVSYNQFIDNAERPRGDSGGGDRQSIGLWHSNDVDIHHNSITHGGLGTVMELSSMGGYMTQTDINIYDNIITLDNPAIGGHTINCFRGDFDIYNNIAIGTNGGALCDFIYTGDGSNINTYAQVHVYHNTVIDYGYFLALVSNSVPGSINANNEFIFKNNIIQNIRTRNIKCQTTASASMYPYITADYNLYTTDTGTKFDWLGTAYNFANYQTASSQEANSKIGDPLFTTEYTDLTLQVGSPAIDAGVDVGVTLDYAGNERDASPDIGAYEAEAVPPDPEPAIVQTSTPITITINSATGIGNVVSEGEAAVTERGLCWSTSANPTTADSKVTSGTGLGYFTGSITGLSTNTTYHVRAYGTNSEGTTYGDDISFTTDKWNYLKHNGKIVTHNGKPVIVR